MIKAANEQCQILPQIQEIPFLLHFLKSLVLPVTTENPISDPIYFFHIVVRMPMMTAQSTHIFTGLP